MRPATVCCGLAYGLGASGASIPITCVQGSLGGKRFPRERLGVEDKTVIRFAPAPGSVRQGVRLNGTYEVGDLIAHGGMGEVFRGFNIVTKDPVAIKMILPELSSNPDAFAMFLREASTLHNLSHEAIVRYFVFSVDPDLQRAYLAMEFVDGPSLTKRLSQGPLPLEDVR